MQVWRKIVEQRCSSPSENPIHCYSLFFFFYFFFFFFPPSFQSSYFPALWGTVGRWDLTPRESWEMLGSIFYPLVFKCGVNCPWACQNQKTTKPNAFGGILLFSWDRSPFASVLMQSCWSLPLLKILFILPSSSAACHIHWHSKSSLGKTHGSFTAVGTETLKLLLETRRLVVMSNGVKLFWWGFERQGSPCCLQLCH